MGFISSLANDAKVKDASSDLRATWGNNRSRHRWREVFGTDKERGDSLSPPAGRKPTPGGSWGGTATGEASFKRLLQAMRSFAPGGWSDDRFEQTRHFCGIAYIAIHRIATQWQQAEFQVFRKDPNHPEGKVQVTRYDPPEGDRQVKPYDLVELLEKPNNQDSWGEYLYRLCQQKYLTGTSLTWMVPSRLGTPMELYCVPTAVAIPQPAINPDFPDGYYRIQPVYPYGPFSTYPTPASAVGAPVPAQWMMRFQFPHPLLRYDGYAPLTALRLHLDEVESIDRSRWYSMKRGINPSGVLNFEEADGLQPLNEPEIERIRAEFENELMGPENSGKLFVATPGAKLEFPFASPKDMDYQSGWDQLVSFSLAGFGITKPAAGMVEDAAYANLWASLQQLHTLTVTPDLDNLGSKLTRTLGPFFGDDLIVEVKGKSIKDFDILSNKITLATNAKAITKNEVLKLLELPTTKEEWGKDIAGDPSPNEKAEQQAQQMQANPLAALMGGGPPGQGSGGPPGQQAPEVEAERPENPQGAGALGPRKRFSLNGRYKVKDLSGDSFYKSNGNGRVKTKVLSTVKSEVKEDKSIIVSPSVTVNLHQAPVSVTTPEMKSYPTFNVPPIKVPDVRVENNYTPPSITLPDVYYTPPSVNVPQTVVNVPELKQPLITVNVDVPAQQPPMVRVENNPTIRVEPQQVTVNVPEQQPPDIYVEVPESPPPTVNVSVPHPKPVRKTIEYNQANMPVTVTEEEV